MERKSVALAILGIVAVIAIVGLVLLFATTQTGAGVYSNTEGKLFPMSRIQNQANVLVETPGWQDGVNAPQEIVYAGGALWQDPLPNQRIERAVTSGSAYKRRIGAIPTALTTCMAFSPPIPELQIVFPSKAIIPPTVFVIFCVHEIKHFSKA